MTNVRVSDDDVDEVRGDLIGPTTHHPPVPARRREGSSVCRKDFPLLAMMMM
jgi:hypothetical protein